VSPFPDTSKEELSIRRFTESWMNVYNGTMGIISTNCDIVPGDNKLFFSLSSFSTWQNNSSYNIYYRPILNIGNIINRDIDESIIDKAKLVCLPNGRLVSFVLYLNDTANDLKISDVLKKCSWYYVQKVLVGWASQSSNRTQSPIDAIGLLIVLQEGEINRILSIMYKSIVYEVINDSVMYYSNNQGGYAIHNFENLTVRELRDLNPENYLD
jgi:hypothetical protein